MMQNHFFSIIVTYNPDVVRLKKTVGCLLEQGFDVIIIDNNSDNRTKLLEIDTNCKFVLLEKNTGIAHALNCGMEAARKGGAVWVLSLDQDTRISEHLLEEYRKHLDLENMGALCPRILREGEVSSKPLMNIEEVMICPTAGFFTTIDVWENSGKYDDWMFIDYVDYDMCMKIKQFGLKVYRINSAYVIQELGRTSINRFFYTIGKKLHIKKIMNFSRVYNHSPLRNYYFVRNALYFQHKYKKNLDMNYELSHMVRWQVKKLLLEDEKFKNISSIARGIRDYKIKIRNQ